MCDHVDYKGAYLVYTIRARGALDGGHRLLFEPSRRGLVAGVILRNKRPYKYNRSLLYIGSDPGLPQQQHPVIYMYVGRLLYTR